MAEPQQEPAASERPTPPPPHPDATSTPPPPLGPAPGWAPPPGGGGRRPRWWLRLAVVLAVVVVAAVAVVLVTSGQGDELRYQVVRNLCPLVDLEPLERRAGGPATSAVPEEVSYVEHECTVDFDASFDVQVHTYIIEQDLEADYHDIWRDDLGDGTTLHEVEGVGTDAFVTSWIADSPLPPEATPGSTTPGTSMNATLYVLDSNLSLTVQMSGVVTEDDVDGTEYDEDLVRTAEDVMAGLERAR